ncbi:unnamed protein product [Closterium sp. NIES-65]|nr:unnamed protein product [Closterium sp. NIES-65]
MLGMIVELNTSTCSSSAAASDYAPSDTAPPAPAPPAPAPSPQAPDTPAATAAPESPSADLTPGPLRSYRQPTPDLLPPILLMSSRSVVMLLFPEQGAEVIHAPLISAIFTKLTPSLFNYTINNTLDIMDRAAFSSSALLALTMDFHKAYELVDKPSLLQALSVLGLSAPFIHWVRLMHPDTYTCISVNNMLGPTFPARIGVPQGCPLAPLLFVCIIEIFQRYMSLFLPSFPLSSTQCCLMASYADDITLFLNTDTELML